jgi:hypothetical protein
MNSGFSGRWDRNRAGALRLWSLLPFVQERSGAYTSALKMAHSDGPKCQEVQQRSPALGSILGSSCDKQAFIYRLGGDVARRALPGTAGLRAQLGRARKRKRFLRPEQVERRVQVLLGVFSAKGAPLSVQASVLDGGPAYSASQRVIGFGVARYHVHEGTTRR